MRYALFICLFVENALIFFSHNYVLIFVGISQEKAKQTKPPNSIFFKSGNDIFLQAVGYF